MKIKHIRSLFIICLLAFSVLFVFSISSSAFSAQNMTIFGEYNDEDSPAILPFVKDIEQKEPEPIPDPEPEPPTQYTKSEEQTLNQKTEEKTSYTDSEIKSSTVITRQVANDTSTSVWLYIGIGGGVLVFAAGGVTAYILIRRKKSGFC